MGWLDSTADFINGLISKALGEPAPVHIGEGEGIPTPYGMMALRTPGTPEFEKEVDRMYDLAKRELTDPESGEVRFMQEVTNDKGEVIGTHEQRGLSRRTIKGEMMGYANKALGIKSNVKYGPEEILEHYKARVPDPVKQQMLQQYQDNPYMIPGKPGSGMVNYFRHGAHDVALPKNSPLVDPDAE